MKTSLKPLAPLLLLMSPAHAEPTASEHRFEADSGETLGYLLVEPHPALVDPDEPRPLVIFLHGVGERGDDLDMVKRHGPPSQALKGDGLPFVVLAPQCPPEQWWNPRTVAELVEEVVDARNIDEDRVHLTGLSMGGFGTWSLLAGHADLFASAVPICGGGDPKNVEAFADTPIWAFHGEADETVPVERTREMESALREAGTECFHATYYPGVGHDSWTRTYANPAVYAWMLQQSR